MHASIFHVLWDAGAQSESLYFCTSKASKVSTGDDARHHNAVLGHGVHFDFFGVLNKLGNDDRVVLGDLAPPFCVSIGTFVLVQQEN